MITWRNILLLLPALILLSCEHTGNNGRSIPLEESPFEEYVLEWSLPEAPEHLETYEAEIPSEPVVADEDEDTSEPQIIIKRDTINGIAVRAPGQITLPEKEIEVQEERDAEDPYYAISHYSTNSYFGVNFDNDILTGTDYYYTNGIKLDLIVPAFAASPFAWPMLPYQKESINYHGMTIVQNMYTPTNPDTIHVFPGDRPFAAYIYVGHFKNTLSWKRRYRQYSEIVLGLIGPGSLGGFVQGQVHNIEPVGWQNQIQNDLVLNYTALIEKGLFNPRYFDLNVFAEGQIGTLYDNLGAGIRLRTGKLNSYFRMPDLVKPLTFEAKDALNLQIGIIANAKLRLIAYNATIQGGVFNPNNSYTIPAEDIERLVLQAGAGIFFAYKQLGMTLEWNYISPEFKDAFHHRWGHINITFCF